MLKVLAAILTVLELAVASTNCQNETSNANLTVHTRTGTFTGGLNDIYPDVRHFKYIPYAKKVRLPSCPQYVTAVPSVWVLNITGNLIVNYGESLTAGLVAQNSAEDCFTLAILTPASTTPDSKLPVVHFLTGGGDVTGGINIPTQMPANWVHRSQKHIVVTTNYRVNIFGYPNARGLNGNTNFVLQDQRKAVEWVAENMEEYGGDPSKMQYPLGTVSWFWRDRSVLFAWYQNPIIRASISSSGVATGQASNLDYAGTNFTFVAKSLGCDFVNAGLELECMRRVPMARIENFVGQYQDNSTLVNSSQSSIAFTRQIDNKYVFSNYTQRYLNGQIAKLPKIIGTTAREASALLPYPVHNATAGPSPQLITSQTLSTVCAAHNTSVLRNQIGLSTFRYEWAGNFTNISPVSWLGAYHYSDLYMLFGTYPIAPSEILDLEVRTSQQMQDYFLDFIVDPSSLAQNGWPEYTSQSGGGKIAQFGADGQVVQSVDGDSVEGACHVPGVVYNTTP